MDVNSSNSQDCKRRSALVLYGSETGNAQDVAEELGRLCERLRFVTNVCALDGIDLNQLLKHDIVLFSISTTGQGQLPFNSQKFWKRLRSVRLPPSCLSSLQFTSFGLGDTSYPKFNYAHRKLYNRLVQLGARSIHDRGESDEQHPEGVDGTLIPWTTGLKSALLKHFPLPLGVEPIPDSVYITPKWRLETVEYDEARHVGNSFDVGSDRPCDDLVFVRDSLVATVQTNERITPTTHFQDTRHIILTLPGKHDYPPGAVLTIYPKNSASDVSALLDLMSWSANADKPLRFVRTTPEEHSSDHIPQAPIQAPFLTLRILLTDYLDIMAVPRRSFFGHLQRYTADEMHLERLQEFTSPDLVDELYDYTTRPRRSILEALCDFPQVKIPWQEVCSVIPMMRGRQFSIASGGLLKDAQSLTDTMSKPSGHFTRVDLLVAIVKYKTIIKRVRQGVATRYIAALRSGEQITATLQNGGLGLKSNDMDKPMVMIGPGTGVAPMRALAYERMSWRNSLPQEDERTKDLLFYGCRNKNVDEYFRHDWASLSLEVFVAYSRDQREKIYVQDIIRHNGSKVYSLLAERGGIVFVCGSSGRMPQAVRQALTDTFVQHGNMSVGDAETFFVKLEKQGRYLQETW